MLCWFDPNPSCVRPPNLWLCSTGWAALDQFWSGSANVGVTSTDFGPASTKLGLCRPTSAAFDAWHDFDHGGFFRTVRAFFDQALLHSAEV